MKRYSLYLFSLISVVLWLILSFSLAYLDTIKERSNLSKDIILERINLAKMINELFLSLSQKKEAGLDIDIVDFNKANLLKEKFNFEDIKYIRILDENGYILQSNNDQEQGRVVDNSLIKEILSKKEIVRDQKVNREKIKEIFYLGHGGKIISIGFSLENIEKRLKRSFVINLIFIIMGAILIIFSTFFTTKSIINPLKKIISALEEVKKGNLETRVNIKSKNEIGELADIFNLVINNLREYQNALEESKLSLEIRVRARTKELEELTENLEEKIKERTKELHQRIEDLEKFHRLAVGREMKMIELKKEIKKLKDDLNKLKKQTL